MGLFDSADGNSILSNFYEANNEFFLSTGGECVEVYHLEDSTGIKTETCEPECTYDFSGASQN